MSNVATAAMTRTQAKSTARELFQSGAWTIMEIKHYLARHGVTVSWNTVARWAWDEWAEREAEQTRERQRHLWRERNGVRQPRVWDADAVMRRMRELSDMGLSMAAVATILRHDSGHVITEGQVRHALQTGRYPKHSRKDKSR